MTANQLAYQRNVETERHNIVTEVETHRHNVVTESQGWYSLSETHRHNVVSEAIGWANYGESVRHNKASESLGWAELSERRRHNVASEKLSAMDLGIKMQSLNESIRHNRVSESQTERYNRANYPMYALDGVVSSDTWNAMQFERAILDMNKGLKTSNYLVAAGMGGANYGLTLVENHPKEAVKVAAKLSKWGPSLIGLFNQGQWQLASKLL